MEKAKMVTKLTVFIKIKQILPQLK